MAVFHPVQKPGRIRFGHANFDSMISSPAPTPARVLRAGVTLLIAGLIFCVGPSGLAADVASAATPGELDAGWLTPPKAARLRAYWWWLNSNVTKEAISRDLQEMKSKGFGGALIMDAGGADLNGNDPVPAGPTFSTPAWRELFRHTLREAERLDLEISLNIQSGWDIGGPMVRIDEAIKILVWSETTMEGPFAGVLPEPDHPDPFYRDICVLATPARGPGPRPTLSNWKTKTLQQRIGGLWSGKTADLVLKEEPDAPGEEDASVGQVVDLTARLSPAGAFAWQPPVGRWSVVRLGYTVSGRRGKVFNPSQGWAGYAIDPYDAAAFRRYWDTVVEPLMADAAPFAGKTLRYLHTDSWDVDPANWTPALREEFHRRRGYDPLPWFAALTGKIINSRSQTNRFLHDYRKTFGELALDNHYRIFGENAHRHGIEIHPESGGPDVAPVDGQRCLSWNDVPMGEFWALSWKGRVTDQQRFHIKQPASAAHTYGHPLVAAEGFTTIGPHWQETIWDNLKPAFDRACTEGMNRLFWHTFDCSPAAMGIPGQQYHAGTHLNPNVTWWSRSAPFFTYLNRCQFMLQQGQFVADALYYYGDHVPNLAPLRSGDPARVGSGYDYDVITEEGLLTRVSAANGRLVLPDGMSYRLLVLPERTVLSLPVLRKLRQLVNDGATVIGPEPQEASGLTAFPENDREVRAIAREVWGGGRTNGRVLAPQPAREILAADGVPPDFAWVEGKPDSLFDYIHRRNGETEIYFIVNRNKRAETLRGIFRVAGRQPELWDPITGAREMVAEFAEAEGRTSLSIDLPPYGSTFVVFRHPAAPSRTPANAARAQPTLVQRFNGPWQVAFDPKWGGPAAVTFDELVSWPKRPEPGIRFYSGEATYRTTFDRPPLVGDEILRLDLGEVRELAEVRVNGKSLGVVWAPPFRVNLPAGLQPTGNVLEIIVVNFWPNRIIGDDGLPPERRFTKTNVRVLNKNTPLMESGLMGPVLIERLKVSPRSVSGVSSPRPIAR